ncbi:hypothetical protein HBI57_233280 [Parastagonospora nodorum]|nr:hypothetical protein HBI57_233280 [Parastagonospora nodorum]KAH6453196.1 hypothetical protein HBI58_206950 [Parastagonospora nodorum]
MRVAAELRGAQLSGSGCRHASRQQHHNQHHQRTPAVVDMIFVSTARSAKPALKAPAVRCLANAFHDH